MSRGRTVREIIITKTPGIGADLPPFLGLAQRHFEKAVPVGSYVPNIPTTLTLPVELLDLLVPPSMLSNIEGIEVVYRKGKP